MDEQKTDLDLGNGAEESAAEAPAEDPLAGVPAEPVEDVSDGPEEDRLGGDGAALDEPPASEVLTEPEEREDESEREPHSTEGMELPPEETAETPAAEETAEEPAPAAEPKPKGSAKKSSGKKEPKTKPRKYKILRLYGDDSIQSPLEGSVEARNGDDAIKAAYKQLAESAEDEMVLVAIPEGYWNEKKVKGRKKQDYAVEVG